jgi:hypothetical protein
MRAGGAEAGEIDRLAPRELVAHMRDPRIGEFRAELVKSRSPHGFAASQRAKRKPMPASLGCRGPIRISGFNLSNLWALHAW